MFGNSFFGAPYFGDSYFGPGGEAQQVAQFVGGWEPRRRTTRDIEEGRRRLGMLPPVEAVKAEEAVAQAVEAASALSKATPETQAATDAMEAQRQAERLYLSVYLAVYPQLVEAEVLENFRLEARQRALELEQEAFSILLLHL